MRLVLAWEPPRGRLAGRAKRPARWSRAGVGGVVVGWSGGGRDRGRACAWSLIAWQSRSCTIAILVVTSQIAISTSAVAQAAAEM